MINEPHRLEPRHVPFIIHALESVGVSRKRVVILYCGVILFYSRDLDPEITANARQVVTNCLLQIEAMRQAGQ